MFNFVLTQFKESIKSPEAEEFVDLILYRPLGFVLAIIANTFKLDPIHLSLLGLISGLCSSYYFFQSETKNQIILGSFFLILSGVFDSSDGQLARLSKKSSSIGLIVDGICDSLVTIVIYISCSSSLLKWHPFVGGLLVSISLIFHSYQCAILDFYHRELLFFGCGKFQDNVYWNPSRSEAEGNVKSATSIYLKKFNQLRLSWINKQQLLTFRSDSFRSKLKNILQTSTTENQVKIQYLYKKSNKKILSFWRLIGVNSHTFFIILFMSIERFDIYLIFFDILLFNLVLLVAMRWQFVIDSQFEEKLNSLLQVSQPVK